VCVANTPLFVRDICRSFWSQKWAKMGHLAANIGSFPTIKDNKGRGGNYLILLLFVIESC